MGFEQGSFGTGYTLGKLLLNCLGCCSSTRGILNISSRKRLVGAAVFLSLGVNLCSGSASISKSTINCFTFCYKINSFGFLSSLVSQVSWRNSGKPFKLTGKREVIHIVNTQFNCLLSGTNLETSRALLHFSLRCQGQFRNWEENFRDRIQCCHLPTCRHSALLCQGVTFGKTTRDFWIKAFFFPASISESGRWGEANKSPNLKCVGPDCCIKQIV